DLLCLVFINGRALLYVLAGDDQIAAVAGGDCDGDGGGDRAGVSGAEPDRTTLGAGFAGISHSHEHFGADLHGIAVEPGVASAGWFSVYVSHIGMEVVGSAGLGGVGSLFDSAGA